MKRYIIPLLLVFSLLFCFASCNKNAEVSAVKPCADVAAAVLKAVPNTDITVTVSYGDEKFNDNFESLYDFDEALIEDGSISYAEKGMSADEISLFVVKNKDDAGLVKTALEKRIETRSRDFNGYAPEEVTKLESARVITNGRYVVLLVGEDADVLRTAFQNAVRPEN